MSKYEIKYTTQFKKDYKLAKRRGLDIEVLVLTLARTGTHSDLFGLYNIVIIHIYCILLSIYKVR